MWLTADPADGLSTRLLRPRTPKFLLAVSLQVAPGITLQGLLSPEDNAAITAFCFFNFVLDVQACAQVCLHTTVMPAVCCRRL